MSDLKEHGKNTGWCDPYWDECVKTEHIEKRFRKRNYAPQARGQKLRMRRNRRRAERKIIDEQIADYA